MKYEVCQDPSPEVKLSHWGEGEWVNEPNSFEFEHEGFLCFGKRTCAWEGRELEYLYGGHWCGYIIVPPNHPWFEKEYEEIECDVHGGLTHAQHDHIKAGYSVGFDCAHSGDYSPSIEAFRKRTAELAKEIEDLKAEFSGCALFDKEYRNIEFVKQECKSMAEQAKMAMQ